MKSNESINNKSLRKKKMMAALNIGFFGGVIWGLFSLLLYYMQFTNVGPSIYAKPLLNSDYVLKWQGHLIGVGFFIFLSILIAFLYAVLLIRFKSPWAGIIYGLVLWVFVFLLLNPLIKLTDPVKQLGLNTNSVMISLYIMIGLFIGYSLSAEFNNQDVD